MVRTITPEYKLLKNFQKIFLEAGACQNVEFKMSASDLKFHNLAGEFVAEEGEFVISIGNNPDDCDGFKTAGFSYSATAAPSEDSGPTSAGILGIVAASVLG